MKRYIIFISLILLLIVAFRSGDKRKVVFTKEAPPPIGPYSQAIRSGNLLFVSGQIALTSNGTLDTSNIENETRQVLVNLKSILSAGGKSMSDVVKVSIFVTDLRNFQKMNDSTELKYF